MADVTKSIMVRNAGTAITAVAGAASQTIVMNRADEKVLLFVRNPEATSVMVRVKANGTGAGGTDLDVTIAQNAIKGIVIESSRFKSASTQKVTVELLGTDGGTYGGTVANVLVHVVEMPKALVD